MVVRIVGSSIAFRCGIAAIRTVISGARCYSGIFDHVSQRGENRREQSAIKIIEKIVLEKLRSRLDRFLKEMHREIIVGTLLCVLM